MDDDSKGMNCNADVDLCAPERELDVDDVELQLPAKDGVLTNEDGLANRADTDRATPLVSRPTPRTQNSEQEAINPFDSPDGNDKDSPTRVDGLAAAETSSFVVPTPVAPVNPFDSSAPVENAKIVAHGTEAKRLTPLNPFDAAENAKIVIAHDGTDIKNVGSSDDVPGVTGECKTLVSVKGPSEQDGRLESMISPTSSFTPILPPLNPFDSPSDDVIESPLEAREKSRTASFITPIAPGDGYLERNINNTSRATGVGDFNEGLADSKRNLDGIFQNEHADYSQYADIDLPMQQPSLKGQGAEEARNEKDDACNNDESCKDEENEDYRRTTVTQAESTWEENESLSEDSNDEESHDDEESVWKNRCCYCFLRLLHGMCNPHIHPPCISNLTHPHLPPCLERISPRNRRIICKSLIIIFMIITISFVCLDLLILHQYLHVWLDSTLAWLIEHPVGGGLAFIGIFLTASLCFFPTALLSLGAGYVYIELYGLGWGVLVAFVICYVGSLIGAAVCFYRSRYLMRLLIERFSDKYPIVRAVDKAFETMGFRLFLLLRLSPSMPFNALNYIGGITAITFRNYWWATCAGIAPGILWTIFVGATFGTVNARGVDGNKEFGQNAVRKGLVLGLGIGLGILAIVGTGVYARKELTKIVIAEQRERAMQEADGIGVPHHLMDGECEAIPEEGDDESSVSYEDLEEQGSSMNDFSLYSMEEVDVMTSTVRSFSTSPSLRQRSKMPTTRSWTPEAVAAELPILPKMLQCISPIKSSGSNMDTIKRTFSSVSTEISPTRTRKHEQQLSASMPPLRGTDNNFSFELEDNSISGKSIERSKSSSESPTSRHALQTYDNIKVALASSLSPNRPLPSPSSKDDLMSILANIDELKVLSDDEVESTASQTKSPMYGPNRRRCNTDPASVTVMHDNANFATAIIQEHGAKEDSTIAQRKQPRQQSPLWTPIKKGLRKRHSSGMLGAASQTLNKSSTLSPSELPRKRAPSPQLQNDGSQQGGNENQRARSSSLPFAPQQPRNRPRASSLPFDLSPSGNHFELDIGNGSDTDGPSREWFWIWA